MPIDKEPLGPSNKEPVAAYTEEYQALVRSLAFISSITRPDTAKSHSVLSKYLQNASQKHLAAAKRVWKFLIRTQWHAICASATEKGVNNYVVEAEPIMKAGIEPLFYGASDASFADDPFTGRSSYGYLFKLFSLPIDWKATVLRSVTKSTPETELMALSVAGSEMEWWQRVFTACKFNPELKPQLWCDNTVAVGIVNKAEDRLQTKLRHVDTHQMWLRQEVEQGKLIVAWVATAAMPADGLTKILSRQKHETFMQQLGLKDVRSLLAMDK